MGARQSMTTFGTMGLLVSLLVVGGCSGGKSSAEVATKVPTTKTVVVLLDKTASIRDQNGVFKDALTRIVASLRGGDKFRLAEITGSSEDDFSFIVSENIPAPPKYNMLSDNKTAYDHTMKVDKATRIAIRKSLAQKVRIELRKTPKAMSTDLFGAINTVGLYLSNKSDTKKILVILSDMIEEDNHGHFQRIKWSDKKRQEILTRETNLGLVPNLTGVSVYVVGARSPRISTTQNIRFFWTEYFKATHATLLPQHYAHSLLSWTE